MLLDLRAELKHIEGQLQAERWFPEQAEGPAKEKRQRTEEEGKQTRHVTLEEVLESCHHVSQSRSVRTDNALCTQGSTASSKGKRCPITLRPCKEIMGM